MSAPRYMQGYNPVAGEWYPVKKAPAPAAYYKYAHQDIIGQRYPDLLCPNVKTAGEISYEINNAPDDYAEVKLVADIDMRRDDGKISVIYIPAGKTLELDLNGHTIKGDAWMIYNFGSVIIKDTAGGGKIVAVTKNTYSIVYNNGGNFTLLSGTLAAEPDDRQDPEAPNWCYGIYGLNKGTINIKGGQIITDGAAGVSSNGTTGDVYVYISGEAKLISKSSVSIYLPTQQNLNIKDKAELTGGICARMGQIVIEDNVSIKGVSLDNECPVSMLVSQKSGIIERPEPIYILSGTFTSDNEEYGNSCSVVIGKNVKLKANSDSVSNIGIYKLDYNYNQTVNVSLKNVKATYKVYEEDEIYDYCVADGVPYTIREDINTDATVTIADNKVYPLV